MSSPVPDDSGTAPEGLAGRVRALLADRRRRIALVVAGLLFFCLLLRWLLFLCLPPGDGTQNLLVEIPKGASLQTTASLLADQGVIGSRRLFVLYTRLNGAGGKLQAGLYQFSTGLLPAKVLEKLVSGDVYARRFAVPEGYSIYQLAELLEQKGFYGREEFLRACRDRRLLTGVGIDAASVEGYLYPSTYDLTKPVAATEFVTRMVAQFDKVYAERFAVRARQAKLTRHQLVTLASLVEKEAVVPAERPLIAAVFLNRLRLGMPLQSDPTALYGVRAFGGKVSGKDVRRSTAYNTYQFRGLPPGPIGNPSAEALAAVLNPAPTSALYFVAKRDGTHHFSATLEEHNRAVARYLKNGAPSAPEDRDGSPHPAGRR